MKSGIAIAVFLVLFLSKSTETCANNDEKYVSKLKKSYQRERDYIDKADVAFMIANYYQKQEDTVCKNWFALAIDAYKEGYKHCDRSRKARALYQIAFCYYRVNSCKLSELYFAKAIKAQYPDPVIYYYYGQMLYIQEKYAAALNAFHIFKEKTDGNQDVDYLISQCREKADK